MASAFSVLERSAAAALFIGYICLGICARAVETVTLHLIRAAKYLLTRWDITETNAKAPLRRYTFEDVTFICEPYAGETQPDSAKRFFDT